MHYSNLYYQPHQGAVAERLAALSGLQRTFFCNSGAEAVEAALKIAKGHGRARNEAKHEIVALRGSFGGRTLGALSVTGQAEYREPFGPLIPGIRFVPPNDVEALESAVGENTAGIVFEPLLGEGGIVEISAEFAARARELATANDALLICDEIQCGLGRTGQAFAFQHWDNGFRPDVITLAKPLAARHDFVSGVRGKGLMLGLELTIPGGDFVVQAQRRGLLMNCTAGNILRFLPPFVIERRHVDEAVRILDDTLQDTAAGNER